MKDIFLILWLRIVCAMKNTWRLNMYCFSARSEKKRKEKVTKNEDHEYKTIVQRMQNDHDCCTHDINNRFAESILNNEIIERKENFSLTKFSNEEFLNTRH